MVGEKVRVAAGPRRKYTRQVLITRRTATAQLGKGAACVQRAASAPSLLALLVESCDFDAPSVPPAATALHAPPLTRCQFARSPGTLHATFGRGSCRHCRRRRKDSPRGRHCVFWCAFHMILLMHAAMPFVGLSFMVRNRMSGPKESFHAAIALTCAPRHAVVKLAGNGATRAGR